MSPFVAYHTTAKRHRASIRQRGLLAGRPHCKNVFGVYVYNDDFNHPTYSRGLYGVRWGAGHRADVWQVAYVGRMMPDPYVENGIVLLETVPPENLSLITGIRYNI